MQNNQKILDKNGFEFKMSDYNKADYLLYYYSTRNIQILTDNIKYGGDFHLSSFEIKKMFINKFAQKFSVNNVDTAMIRLNIKKINNKYKFSLTNLNIWK